MKKFFLPFSIVLLFLFTPIIAFATTYYAAANASGSGTTPSNPGDLKTLLLAALPNDQVWVAAGDYTAPAGDGFAMNDGVSIYGGFNATYTNYTPGVNNPDTTINKSILRGNPAGGRVVTHAATTTTMSVFSGFIVTGGNAKQAVTHVNSGGGIYVSNNAIIDYVTFDNNKAGTATTTSHGGAIANDNCAIRNCIITNNTAAGNGGGVYNISGGDIVNCNITNNTAGGKGGGIYNVISTITNVLVAHNKAANGGGIYHSGGGITNCTISENIATTDGGGILYANVNGTIRNTIIWNNVSPTVNRETNASDYTRITNCIIKGWTNGGTANSANNPFFQNAPKNNFKLLPFSPAIEAGDNVPINATGQTLDLAGFSRIYNSGIVDIGAYEYQGAKIAPPTGPVLFVNSNLVGAPGNGQSWSRALLDIDIALTLADIIPAINEIRVAYGTYYAPVSDGFIIRKGVSVYGGQDGLTNILPPNQPALNFSGFSKLYANPTIGGRVLTQQSDFLATEAALWSGFSIQSGDASKAETNIGNGGGAFIKANATLSNILFENNIATNGAGAYVNAGGTIIDGVFTLNNASANGGGVYNAGKMINCTLNQNTATTSGGGVYNTNQILNSILWGNTAASNAEVNSGNITYSIIKGWTNGGTGNKTTDPLFVDASTGNFRLTPGSPGINAGTIVTQLTPITRDIDRLPRIVNDTIDLGAYEYLWAGLSLVDDSVVYDTNAHTFSKTVQGLPAISTSVTSTPTLGTGTNAGAYPSSYLLHARSYLPTYPNITLSANLVIKKADQTITFDCAQLNNKKIGDSFTLTATASSTLPVTFTSDAPSVATVNSTTGAANVLAKGTANITVSQTGDSNYNPATDVVCPMVILSNDSTLSAITVSSGTLSPTFDPAVTSYTVTVPYSVMSLTLDGTTTDPNATFTGSGVKALAIGTNTFQLVVNSEDGASTQTYTVVVTRQLNTDASLLSLTANQGTLTPVFATGTYDYTVTVPYTVTSITLNATTTDPNATFTGGGTKTLAVGTNTYPLVVTAQDGVTTQTYTVNVVRQKNTDASLINLTTSTGTLSPVFSPTMYGYSVTVPNNVNSITIFATANDPNATIAGTGVMSLAVGANTFHVTVTAADGVTKLIYSVVVTRQANNDASLLALSVNPGTLIPGFVSNVYGYTVTVANAVTSIDITATPNDPNATVTGNGTQPLAVGANFFNVEVTAADGTTKLTYLIKVIRELNNDPTLVSLSATPGQLIPTFDPNVLAYTVNVSNTATSIVISATATDPLATIIGTGAKSLVVGQNSFDVEVTAADGVTKRIYTLVVVRGQNTDASLTALSVSPGTLVPGFSPTIFAYTVTVNNSVASITLSATSTSPDATITGTGVKTLTVGQNSFPITVTAADGSTSQTYTVIVVRNQSADVSLQTLTVSPGTLTPAFTAGVFDYSVNLPSSATTIQLDATTTDPAATISGTGVQAVAVGANTYQIEVTAADGTTTQMYTIDVTRAAPVLPTLSGLSVSAGALSPAFNSDTMAYSVTVPNNVTTLDITATPADPLASVAIAKQVSAPTPFAGAITSSGLPLTVGVNKFTILATASDNVTTNTYTLTVTRQPAVIPPTPGQSSNANLSEITVSGGTLEPVFNPDVTNYVVNVDNGTGTVDIEAIASDSFASITGLGVQTLNVGNNTFQIIVTAQDGTVKIYTIVVNRSTPTNIDEVDHHTLKVYPTLTTGKVYIETKDGTIPTVEIYTMSGKFVGKIKSGEIDLSEHANGIYLLRVEGKTIKVVKQ